MPRLWYEAQGRMNAAETNAEEGESKGIIGYPTPQLPNALPETQLTEIVPEQSFTELVILLLVDKG